MTARQPIFQTSYEVALAGKVGAAYREALATAGAERPGTTSLFLLPGSTGADICEVFAMLQSRGLVVLDVRQVRAKRPGGAASR